VTRSEPIVVESLLTRADFGELQKAWRERARAQTGRISTLAAVIVPLLLALVLVFLLDTDRRSVALAAFLLGGFAVRFASAWLARLFRPWSLPDEHGLVLGRVRMELSGAGIHTARDDAEWTTRWTALRDVTRTETHVFLWVDRAMAYILPLRDLPADVDADAVLQSVADWAGGGRWMAESPGEGLAPEPAGQAATKDRAQSFLSGLVRRLLWRAVPGEGAASSDSVILACAAAGVAVWLGFDRYSAGPDADWYFGGVVGIVWYGMGVLALAWVLHRAAHGTVPFRRMLASTVGGLPLPLGLALAAQTWAAPDARNAVYVVLCIAVALYLRRELAVASGGRVFFAMPAAALLVLSFGWATTESWVYPHLWYAADGEDDGTDDWMEGERLLFEQADRIDAAAARLEAGDPDRPDVFFLGLAGVAEERVFAEELLLAQRVISDRYGAGGRSLLLVNDRRDRETHPLATVHGLRRALARMGERMDRADDVLFLMLTSHGSDDPFLSISNGEWPLEQLDADTLRSALDESLVKWRVIVISACHSGAFIEALADENTIILTSAAGDRTSFGCSDDRDVTEFGAAFVRDALPHAPSLASAFDQAKRRVAEREQEEGLAPSLPQAHWGRAIRVHWERVERGRAVSPSVGLQGFRHAPDAAGGTR